MAIGLAAPALAASSDAPMRPDLAFRYTVDHSAGEILVKWDLEPGYYLYKKKLSFESSAGSIALGQPVLPEGEVHEDEYFGKQNVFRNAFEVRIPYSGSGDTTLSIKSQGCADLGICYPPQTWNEDLTLAAAAGSVKPVAFTGANASDPFNLASPTANNRAVTDSGLAGNTDVRPATDIFRPVVTAIDAHTLEVAWQIEPAHYLYKHNVSVTSLNSAVRIPALALPDGKPKVDEYFGETEVYYDAVIFEVPLFFADDETQQFSVELGYQGCADEGICYPPLKRYATIDLSRLDVTVLPHDAAPPKTVGQAAAAASPDASDDSSASAPAAKESEQGRFAKMIHSGNLALIIASFFGAGLLLSLTPCVLPMIPILSGILAREGEDITPLRGFMLALVYVLGMAIVYTIAGALFAIAGQQAQAVFQDPYVLTGFALLFVALALSMFGLFELQMPSSIQSRLASISGKQKSGTYVGAFVMGALSSLIVTACVAPPLVAALAVIGQSGDVVLGGLALFALSIGMGAPLLVVGASAGKLMPKAGPWMVAIKVGFGFLMLGLAIYILSRILPGSLILAAYAVLLIVAAIFLGGLDPLGSDSGPGKRIAKSFGLLGLMYGAILLLGSLTGGSDPLRPLPWVANAGHGATAVAEAGVSFKKIETVADLNRELATASAAGRPVMLDLYADWCASCEELEKYTFSDARVRAALGEGLALQADLSKLDEADLALMSEFGLFGLPAIIFFDTRGKEQPGFRVVGMMHAEEFALHVKEAVDTGA